MDRRQSLVQPGTSSQDELLLPEIYFLITKFLSNGPCRRTYDALRDEIDEHQLMPRRLDWLGNDHPRTYDDLNRSGNHIKPDHLFNVCRRLRILATEANQPTPRSLLGFGRQSILRNPSIEIPDVLNESALILRNGAPPLPPARKVANHPTNFVRALLSRESMGHSVCSRTVSPAIYTKHQSHCRLLGHLSAVYCVTFDRTGKYIFTGADDRLVKIWSATDGRLLATLRGHEGEITDFAVNYENTLLASGSMDKLIRVWDLKTTATISILAGHSQHVTSLKFCPLIMKDGKRYLVSTGNDGSICFWTWNCTNNSFNPKPFKFIERSKATCHILSSAFSSGGMFLAVGSNDKHVRIYITDCISAEGPAKILELETHSDNVDSLQFCNWGTRFISGSRDGTALIWSYESQRWKTIVLKMVERLPGDPPLDEAEMVKIKVNMVGWTCDDRYVITSASDHTIKVWNPENGKLIHSLRDHEDDVFVIESHPRDPLIFLTGGHDGKVIIWNVVTGKPIQQFNNPINGQGHGAIFDARWSPDGQTIVSTDSHGHLSIYGFGASTRYDRIPREVFFHTDYRPLVRDINHYVIDEQTQCPPHLMPPPFLVDVDGNPHEPKYQRLVPGRENCRDEQLVPEVAIQNERGVGEILEAANPAENERQPTIDDMINVLLHQNPPALVAAAAPVDHGYAVPANVDENEPRQRAPSGNQNHQGVGLRREGDLEGVRQVRVFRESGTLGNVWKGRVVVKPLTQSELVTMRSRIKQLEKSEGDEYEKQSRKKAAPVPVVVKDQPNKVKMTRRRQRLTQQSQGLGQVRIRRRDNEIPDLSESSHAGSGAESWAESRSESESETEDSDEDGWNAGQSRRGRGKKADSAPEVASGASESESETTPVKIISPKKRREIAKKAKHEQLYNEFSGKELPDKFKYPDWLSETLPRRTPYFPQIGDEVVYFKKGHMAYLDEVKKVEVYDLGKPKNEFFKKKVIKDQVYAKVTDIKYEVKPPRLVSLKLIVMDGDKETKEWFTVRYHDMPNVIDFIVLKQFVDGSLRRYDDLSPGNRYKAIVDNEWWLGTVANNLNSSTPFQSIEFKWDSGETEPMSPWDLEPVRDEIEADPGVGIPVLDEEHEDMAYKPEESDDWPECGRDVECDRISRGLEILMQTSIAEHFNVPVDLEQFPVYGMVIPYFIDLSLIKRRVESRFYRRKQALKFDISFIEKNCLEFNEANSNIAVSAKMLTTVLNRLIDDETCSDPTPIYQEVQENRSDFLSETSCEEDEEPCSSRSMSTRKSGKPDKARFESSKRTWQERCIEFIKWIFTLSDSEPFRYPVDPIAYPDYNMVIDTPMDLNTIREQLESDCYESSSEFLKDINLVFENARKYTPSKKSPIFTMTVRMSNLCSSELRRVINQRSSSHSKKLPSKRMKKTSKRRISSGSMDEYEPGPSTSFDQPGPSRVKLPKRTATRRGAAKPVNGNSKPEEFLKTLVESDETDEDDAVAAGGSETEIDENEEVDSDATEIEDEEGDGEPLKKQDKKGKRKKKAVHNGRNRKKRKVESGSDTEYEVDKSSSRSASRTSNTTSTSTVSHEVNSDSEALGRRGGRSVRSTNMTKTRTRNGGVRSYRDADDGSDYEYENRRRRNPSQLVSSRGRVIKYKPHARTGQVC